MGQQEIEQASPLTYPSEVMNMLTVNLQRVKREIVVWRSLSHPNITQFLGIFYLREGMQPAMVSPYLSRNDLLAYTERHPESKLIKVSQKSHIIPCFLFIPFHYPGKGNCRRIGILTLPDDSARRTEGSKCDIWSALPQDGC